MKRNKRKLLVQATVVVALLFLSVPGSVQADDYYNYGSFNPGIGYTTGIAGYVDTAGNIEGVAGGEYLFVTGGPSYGGNHYAYIYRVETAGDPALHPSNPDATGPIAPRTFTQVGSPYYMGSYTSGHENAFYVNDSGIYYGADDYGITHWDFGWSNRTVIAPTTPITTQTFGYDEATGNYWAGGTGREMYMYDGTSWTYQGTHKFLGGGHHDGMEVINGSLFVSDMTSDIIAQYELDGSIDWANPDNEFTYSESAYVEGMGYGPNKHIWVSGWSSGTFYELGGGKLQIILEGVPDQSICYSEVFKTFDLDVYTVGTPPFTWSYGGNVSLAISIDVENVVTVTYPHGWMGSETIIFTVTDSVGNTATDDATFEVKVCYIVVDIDIDIKPGSCPNPLNVKDKGVLPVAILGSEDFDVFNIDPASIRLEDVAPVRSSYEDVATPMPEGVDVCECTTEGPDGYLDLTLKFNVQEIVAALGEVNDGEELELTLTGELNDGTPIEGKDCILIISKGKPE